MTARSVNDRLRRAQMLAEYTGSGSRHTWGCGYRAEMAGGRATVTSWWHGERLALTALDRATFRGLGLQLDLETGVVERVEGV